MSQRIRSAVFIGVCVVAWAAVPLVHSADGTDSTPLAVVQQNPVPVNTAMIHTEDLPVVVESVGRLFPEREVMVSAEIPGEISHYSADVGDKVGKGMLLAEINPLDYELALEQAQSNLGATTARLEAATSAYNRFKKLLPRKVISRDSFDKIESEYKTYLAQQLQAAVGVKIAGERLKKTRLTAPFAGLVATRYIELGQLIAFGDPVMTLVDLDRMRVKIFLAEKDFVHVDSGDPVRIIVEAYPGRVFPGLIDRIDIKADQATNTFGVEILIDNKDLLLKAGLSARVYLTTRVLTNVILIPQSAVLFRENRTSVFVVDGDHTARERTVALGIPRGDRIQVADGLSGGDMLIVRGQNYVKSGEQVTVNNETH
jgi:RND family efflux transporter MFP subunit